MAKRFIDTELWNKGWFRKLNPQLKIIWLYLCTKSDHAGIWEIDIDGLNFNIGSNVTLNDIKVAFQDKITHREDKLLINSFVKFQYGELNENNKVHRSVLKRMAEFNNLIERLNSKDEDIIERLNSKDEDIIERLNSKCLKNTHNQGAMKPLGSPLQGAKDKEKDIDLDKDQDKETFTFICGANETGLDFESLYFLYPRKIGKTTAIKKFKTKIKTVEKFEKLKQAIVNYARYCERQKIETKFIKHFSTFVNCWEDWIDVPIEKKTLSEAEKKKISINYDLMEELHNGTETNSDASGADGGSFWNSFKQDEG